MCSQGKTLNKLHSKANKVEGKWSFINFLKNNIQFNQTLFLIIILIIGIQFYPIYFDYKKLLVVFSTTIFFSYFFHYLETGEHKFPYSGVNPGFGISFFLRTDELIIYFFAAFMAILSKYIFRVKSLDRHFFNPSNFGVVISLIFFQGYAWVNTLQWGNYLGTIYPKYIFILGLIFLFGFLINWRVFKVFGFKYYIDYLSVFVLTHIVLFFIIPHYESWNTFVAFFSTTFFIFTFFMISDPKTVPTKSISRVFFAVNIALAFYALQFFMNEAYSLVLSLTVNSLTLPFIWKLEGYEKKNYNVYFSLAMFLLLVAIIAYGIYTYGQPDLLFDNICNKVVCK